MKCECGGDMKHHDKAVRIVREKGGAKHRIYIERVKCEKCGKIRRIFPENILPHKQYDKEIVDGVKEGLIDSDTLGFEDYPCELTMKHWREEFAIVHFIYVIFLIRSSTCIAISLTFQGGPFVTI